jgi:hypothetical protein
MPLLVIQQEKFPNSLHLQTPYTDPLSIRLSGTKGIFMKALVLHKGFAGACELNERRTEHQPNIGARGKAIPKQVSKHSTANATSE